MSDRRESERRMWLRRVRERRTLTVPSMMPRVTDMRSGERTYQDRRKPR
jgi:hypothetical protein